MFILEETFSDSHSEFYSGKTYTINHQCFAVSSGFLKEAKQYKTKYNAEKSKLSVFKKTGRLFELKELEEK